MSKDLYVIQMAVTGDLKIGRSSNVKNRLKQLQTGAPHRLKVILIAEGQGHRESQLHQSLRAYRNRGQRGEWFQEDALGSLPADLYNLIPVEILEDPDWWKRA